MKSVSAIKKKKSFPKKEIKVTSFPMVAIGASAGGLEAITALLQNLPSNTGMAFIYVQHLSPDYKSMLASILSKSTEMKVLEVTNMIHIEPNVFYVIPPDKEMSVMDGKIKLKPRKRDRPINLPIDNFFSSLAETYKEKAVGIILSGSATDGTLGLKAIKNEGGVTFAQDNTAKFTSMPQSAIVEGVVDFVLSPKEIAHELVRFSKHPYVKSDSSLSNENEIDNSNPELKNILYLIHKRIGVDFSHYKMTTIKRRILRRMLLYKIKTLKQYAKLLGQKESELDLLYQDLLINVTRFFRDIDSFHYLKTTLLPRLLKNKETGKPLRIWVVACSTGEEAYSIAMELHELLDHKFTNIPIQIFGTDLSEQAISKARKGEYSRHDVESISKKRLQRFFIKSDGGYRIIKSIRDMCVFAPHNVLSDPPFSRIDLISCCNLFIYFDSAAQKKAVATFHYALNDNGYLMLGKSETIGTSGQLFAQLNKKLKIYSRKKHQGLRIAPNITTRITRNTIPEKTVKIKNQKPVSPNLSNLDSTIDAILLTHYIPASVVINLDMEILQFRGATSLYLEHLSGKASLNILKMTKPEISFELRNAIHKAIKTKHTIHKSGIEIKIGTELKMISLDVVPLKIEWDEPLLLILFKEQEQVETYSPAFKGEKNSSLLKERKIKKLEEELSGIRSDMHTANEEYETAHEELQSANEEIVSNNEELQSMNEELETSKEEIESTNEELITTNNELQTRNDLLTESYAFSEAIIATLHEPMLILDKELHVKFANKSFYKNFRVNESATEGTSVFKLGNKQWDIPQLHKLLEDILSKNSHFRNFKVTHTFPEIGEKIMLLNANLLIQKTSREKLILLAIEDITESTQFQIEKQEKEQLKKNIREHKADKQELERSVEERTNEINKANKNLEQKNAELERVNKELTAFTYLSSHDLQEPLRKIQTFETLILAKEHKNLSVKGKDYFQRMQEASRRMHTLIEDLLSFSKININNNVFEKGDLNKILGEVKKDLSETIREKHATIEYGHLCEANIIPFQFRQLMNNLIGNALKFSDPKKKSYIIIKSRIIKGIEINNTRLNDKVGQEKLNPQKKYCHISVIDNGIGFEPQFSERIFEIFQRLHEKEKFKGTGIGLAICKKIVENHHGIITASGALNKGATFDIYIPV